MENISNKWGVIYKTLAPRLQNVIANYCMTQDQFKTLLTNNKEWYQIDTNEFYFHIDDLDTLMIDNEMFFKDEYDAYRNNCTAPDSLDSNPLSYEEWKDSYSNINIEDVSDFFLDNLHKIEVI